MLGNGLEPAILMVAIVALFSAVGGALWDSGGMMMALMLAAGMNIYAYWFSDKAVLKMYGAQEVTPDNMQFRNYYNMVKELAENAPLPMPKVYVMDEAQPNAFATGRNPEHAAVAVTTGIMQALIERELRGVMAHELVHLKNRDMLISTISATMAGAISSIGTFGMLFGDGRNGNGKRSISPIMGIVMMFLAPIAASLI